MNSILKSLNAQTAEERLSALREIISAETCKPQVLEQFANNHIHTSYSFSPYSPTAAVYFARQAGLPTAGIMDHDSIAGAFEFIEAGKIAGVATTVGLECRVSLAGTALENRLVNNPDQKGVAYMALHGVPHGKIEYLQNFFAPLREKRNVRNRKMVDNINSLMSPYGIEITFDDVLALSEFANGGSVTERHVLFALAKKIYEVKGNGTLDFLENTMKLALSAKQREFLSEPDSGYFLYDLLGVLKSSLVKLIYIPATDECLHISELSALAKEIDALFCYAYLGDVGDSVTGDKATQKFEDDYIEELFDLLKDFGVDAVTYMPSRNTKAQLKRVMELCESHSFMQISGEDINSPRQKFICQQLALPEYSHLIDATWNLIKYENDRS